MRNTLSFLVLLVLVTGCASWPPPQQSPADEAPSRPVAQQDAPLVRTGRYTALAQGASDAERDPLAQTVTLRFPAQVRTVRAAIEHALRGTGYRFADFDAGTAVAPDLPLPDVQRELGPLPLAEALAVLAGESWQTRVNPVTRIVSMSLRPEFRRYLPAAPAPEALAAAPVSPPAVPAAAMPAAALPAQLAAVTPTPTPASALVAASAPATDVPAKPVAVAVAAPPQPVAEPPGVTQPWRPGEQGGHGAVAEAAGSPASGRMEVLEDGLPAGQRPKNPWLAGLRFANLQTDDAGAGKEGGGSSPDRLDASASHAEPQPAQLAMAEPSPAAARAPRGVDRPRRADRDRPDTDETEVRTPVATLQPLVRLGPGTLSVVLDTWLRNAGWALVWKSGADFRIEVPFALDAGSPADPVRLLASLSDLYGIPHCAYPANRTIVVLQPGTNLREECR